MNDLITRLRRRRCRDDSGLTLVELLVVMIVMTVIVGAVAAIFTATLRTTSATSTKLDEGNEGRVALEAVSRALRTVVVPVQLSEGCATCTDAFISGSPFSVAFYADLDNDDNKIGPSRVTIGASAGGTLTEVIQPPDPASVSSGNFTWSGQNDPSCVPLASGCLKRQLLLADGVQQGASAPLFTYYPENSGTPLVGTLTSDQMKDVDSIDLILTIALPNRGAVVPTTYVNRVALSNIDVYIADKQGGS